MGLGLRCGQETPEVGGEVHAALQVAEARHHALEGERVRVEPLEGVGGIGALGGAARTLYLGGGTPSLWEPSELGRFLTALRAAPGLAPGAELTLEANPAEVTPDRVAAWRDLGVNRVSLGVQALDDPMLRSADRLHDAATAERALDLIATAGFASWSADLIFGLAQQTLANWDQTLSRALAFAPPHLSVYALTVEPRTTLARQVRDGAVTLPGDSVQVRMLFRARERLRAAGYVHYEVSSYAKPGHRAVHNSSYWEMRPYLGLGPGAHGFAPPERRTNVRRPRQYIERATAAEVERARRAAERGAAKGQLGDQRVGERALGDGARGRHGEVAVRAVVPAVREVDVDAARAGLGRHQRV